MRTMPSLGVRNLGDEEDDEDAGILWVGSIMSMIDPVQLRWVSGRNVAGHMGSHFS